jgi:hypothetical protein
LKLKLDMVYRDLPTETAQQKFMELTTAPQIELPPPEPKVAPPVPKSKRKNLAKGK